MTGLIVTSSEGEPEGEESEALEAEQGDASLAPLLVGDPAV